MKISLGASTIAIPLPVWVIGTYDATGQANAMTASWTGVCCSQPPCVYFSVRPERFTYECVHSSQAFTVNIPSAAQAVQADYLGCVSGRSVHKLAAAGLTAVSAGHVDAPAIAEFPLVLECQVLKEIELGTHIMVVGQVLEVSCEAGMLGDDGKPDPAKLQPFTYSTCDGSYYGTAATLGRAYTLGRDVATR